MNRKNRRISNSNYYKRKRYHKKNKKDNKIKNFQESITNKAKEYINDENIKKNKRYSWKRI